MALLERKKPASLSPLDIQRVAQAVAATLAGHSPQAHHEPAPPTAPQSPRMRALLRSVAQPAPTARSPAAPPPGPAATANKDEARLAPPPYLSPIPLTELPVAFRRDELGRVTSIDVGKLTLQVSRDLDGRIKAMTADDGFQVAVSRRDAFGSIAGLVATPPVGRR